MKYSLLSWQLIFPLKDNKRVMWATFLSEKMLMNICIDPYDLFRLVFVRKFWKMLEISKVFMEFFC